MDHSENRHQLGPTASIAYVLGGKGRFTLVGKTARFTYKLSRSEDGKAIFVKVLVGPDNESSYQYLGYIKVDATTLELRAGQKGDGSALSFRALDWYLRQWVKDDDVCMGQAEFWHEGVCGRCGRALTVPTSIEMGLGPTCASK